MLERSFLFYYSVPNFLYFSLFVAAFFIYLFIYLFTSCHLVKNLMNYFCLTNINLSFHLFFIHLILLNQSYLN